MFTEDFGAWLTEKISAEIIEELVTGEDPSYNVDTVGIRKVDLTIPDADLYNKYLSYNSETGQFTVIKSFYAKLDGWIINNPAGSGSNSQGAIRVNGTQVVNFTFKDNNKSTYMQLNVNDLIDVYVTSTTGWPCPRLRVSAFIPVEQGD